MCDEQMLNALDTLLASSRDAFLLEMARRKTMEDCYYNKLSCSIAYRKEYGGYLLTMLASCKDSKYNHPFEYIKLLPVGYTGQYL